MPAKGKKPSKTTNGIAHHEPAKLQEEEREDEAERLAKLKQQEQERQRKWIDDWDRKIAEDERLEDCKACCAPDRFFPKPRTQSNIWIQVNHEKSTQQVQMSFMYVSYKSSLLHTLFISFVVYYTHNYQ